ncbi:MAG TPA: hypothetical protein V6D14_19605 [Coleofasciculaceae cyanobacterium]
MKRIVAATLLTLAAVPVSLLFTEPAKAGTYSVCYPVTQPQVSRDDADHPGAYGDGYREGRASARNGDAYRPRSAGGEFSRGFEDGYYGRRFSGQQYSVPNRVDYYTTQQCNTYFRPNRIPNRVLVLPRYRDRIWRR